MGRWLGKDGAASILTNNIYVVEGGVTDRSRWLELGLRVGSNVCCSLSELCHPSALTSLKSVNCPLDTLRYVVEHTGTLQITADGGYCIVTVDELGVALDFRGRSDSVPTRCRVSRAEVLSVIERMTDPLSEGRLVAGRP